MKVSLVFPPQWCPTQPYLSLPSLSGYLLEKGFDVKQHDLNVEAYDTFLSPKYLLGIKEMISDRLSILDSKKSLPPEQQKEYGTLFQGVLIAPEIIEGINRAKNILRDPGKFYNFRSYAEAQRIVQRGLRMVSSAYYPTEMSLSSFDMQCPQSSMADIIAATGNMRENPFLSLYQNHFLKQVLEDRPDVLGISIISVSQVIPGLTLARLVKKSCPQAHVVIGGSVFTRLSDKLEQWPEIFGTLFDSVVVYEGEIPLLKLCQSLSAGQELAGVPNLVYKQNGHVRVNPLCPPEEINSLPTPCFDSLPLGRYFSPHVVLPIVASRGCYWGQCTFCDHGLIYGHSYRRRSVKLLVDDLQTLMQKHSTKFFTFNDESIAPAHLRQISEAFISEGLDTKCNADVRLESSFNSELMKLAFAAGFLSIYFGLESACNRVLALMGKGINRDAAKSVLQGSAKAGIWNHTFIIFGFPTETEAEAQQTIDFIFDNREVVHSVGHAPFLLTRRSPIMTEPEKFSISGIFGDSSGVLDLWSSYSTAKGLTKEQTADVALRFSERVRKEYRDWPTWGMLPREHLLLYLDHYGRQGVSQLLDQDGGSSMVVPAHRGVQVAESCVPQIKPGVLSSFSRFDVARILRSKTSSKGALKPNPVVILWNLETDTIVSVTPSAAGILARCNGKKTLSSIAGEIALKHSLDKQEVTADCVKILRRLTRLGLCEIISK